MESAFSAELLEAIEQSLRVQAMFFGRTPIGSHDRNLQTMRRSMMGVNSYTGGGVHCRIGEAEPIYIAAGEGIVIPPDTVVDWLAVDHEAVVSHWFVVGYNVLGSLDLCSFLTFPAVLPAAFGAEVRRLNDELVDAPGGRASLPALLRRHRVAIELLECVLPLAASRPDTLARLRQMERLEPALRLMREDLTRDLTTADLAAAVYLSEPRFFALFREAFGMAPGQYLQRLRLTRAEELLINSDLRIHEVAVAAGYNDSFHFSRQFKKHVGLSPSHFREQAGA